MIDDTLKSKLKTTEFWLSLLAIVVGGLMGAGVFGDGSIYARIGGWIVAALASGGYTVARTLAKSTLGYAGPGYKTTELWTAVATAGLVFVQSNFTHPGSAPSEVIGDALTILPVVIYMGARGALKQAATFFERATAQQKTSTTDLMS